MTSVTMATASPSQQAVVDAHKAARINFSFAHLFDGAVDFHAVSDDKRRCCNAHKTWPCWSTNGAMLKNTTEISDIYFYWCAVECEPYIQHDSWHQHTWRFLLTNDNFSYNFNKSITVNTTTNNNNVMVINHTSDDLYCRHTVRIGNFLHHLRD